MRSAKIDILVNKRRHHPVWPPGGKSPSKIGANVLMWMWTGTWLMSKEVVNAYMLAHGGRIVKHLLGKTVFSAAPTAVVLPCVQSGPKLR